MPEISQQSTPKSTSEKNYQTISPFHIACMRADEHVVNLFIENGADVNLRIHNHEKYSGYSALHFAIEYNSVGVVNLLLENGADKYMQESRGLAPISVALTLRRIDVVNLILKFQSFAGVCSSDAERKCLRETVIRNGVDIDSVDEKGDSLLHAAVANESVEVVQFVLECGANVSLRNNQGLTPLLLAFGCRDNRLIKLVASADCSCYKNCNPTDDRGLSHFHAACMRNDPNVVRTFLQNGVEVDCRVNFDIPRSINDIDETSYRGYTPLHFAVENDCPDVVDLLVNNGADVNARNGRGETPLHLASGNHTGSITRTLIDNGAQIYISCNRGKTPLHLAALSGNIKAVELMLMNGVNASVLEELLHNGYSLFNEDVLSLFLKHVDDVNSRDNSGLTLLYKAVERNQLKQVRILLDRGVEVNCHRSKIESSLHLAARNNSPKMVDLLLENGADVDARNEKGETALHAMFARELVEASSREGRSRENEESYDEALDSLLLHGCDIDGQDFRGRTSLHVAVEIKNLEGIRALLRYGADVNVEDNEGRSAVLCDGKESYYVRRIFREHVQRLEAMELRVSDANSSYLRWDLVGSSNGRMYERVCRSEIERMAAVDIRGDSSLYDVLSRNVCDSLWCAGDDVFGEIARSSDLDSQYRCYGFLIRKRYREARRTLCDVENTLLQVGIPSLCVDIILSYLVE